MIAKCYHQVNPEMGNDYSVFIVNYDHCFCKGNVNFIKITVFFTKFKFPDIHYSGSNLSHYFLRFSGKLYSIHRDLFPMLDSLNSDIFCVCCC